MIPKWPGLCFTRTRTSHASVKGGVMRGLTCALLVFTLLQPSVATPRKGVVHEVLFMHNKDSALGDLTLSTHIPSTAGGERGIYVQLTLPDTPRFKEGAPVAIHVTGGWSFFGVSELKSSWHPQGIIDIQFNWPGCDRPGQESGGTFDDRGPNCIAALADVARFAMGLLPDKNGHYISDLTGTITPLSDNVGMIGWSNGGNATITAAAHLAFFTDQLAWIVNWESPVGDGMPTVICGRPENLNPAYDPDSGQFDSTGVAYDATIDVQGGFTGGFYFDINGNGLAERGTDWFPTPLTYENKLYYTEWLRRKAEDMGLPAGSHIATLQETETFWYWRNGENHMQTAVSGHPDLMFIVQAGETDHVQGAPDHPHVLNQYLGFIKAGCRFVRLNPDRSMVEDYMGHSMPNATDNDAFADYDHLTIRSALNPSGPGGIPNNIAVGAAVCELVDRTRDSNVDPQLDAVSTGIQMQESQPRQFHLEQNFPNPFNHSTTIRFHIGHPGRVHIRLYDLLGHEVNAWDRELKQGEHTLRWDGRDRTGRIVPSGTYFLQMSGDQTRQVIQMQMIR